MTLDELIFSCDVNMLPAGGSYGNMEAFARADAASNLDGLYSPADDHWYCGQVRFRILAEGKPLTPMVTRFFPAYQETIYGAERIVLSKRMFVPFRAGYQQAVCWQMDFETEGHQYIQIDVDIRWPAVRSCGYLRQPPLEAQEVRVRQEMDRGLLVTRTIDTEREVRVFGSNGPPSRVVFTEPGRARLSFFVLAEGYVDVPFILTFSRSGEQVAWNGFLANGDVGVLLQDSSRRMEEAIRQGRLITPDPVINQGLAWAAVNTLRVQHRYRRGAGVSHKLPGDEVVIGDAIWYAIGADSLTPDFVSRLYEFLGRYGLDKSGKAVDRIRGTDGTQEDYGLNINDDTPLFIIGVHHHYTMHGDTALLEHFYPRVRDAANWIIRQIQGRLIWVQLEGTHHHGIAGWRDDIPGYRLGGAVTEINALCAWALRCAAELAAVQGDTANQARFESEAAALATAVHDRLISPETGLYMLTLDLDGTPDHGLTVDQVFPLLAGIAPDDVRSRVLERLWSPAWMSSHGLRTIGEDEPAYDPAFASGLMGGIWPHAWAWAAMAGRERADRLADALHRLCALCAPSRDGPLDRVPGQFPQWLDGDVGACRGDLLNPQLPPMLLWLALEGVAGIQPRPNGLLIEPSVPSGWSWLVCERVPWRGDVLTVIYLDGVLHTDRPIESSLPVCVYERIERAGKGNPAFVLRRGSEAWVFACAPGESWAEHVRVGDRHVPITLASGEACLISVEEAGS